MFLCAIDLNIRIFVDFSHIVLLYQLCVSSSRRHNDTQQTCFVKCKDIFQTKISSKLLHHILSFSLLCFFCCCVPLSQCGSGEKKRCSFLFCALACRPLSFSRTTLDNRFFGHFHILRRPNKSPQQPNISTQSGQIMLVTHVCIRQQPPCQVLPAIHSL